MAKIIGLEEQQEAIKNIRSGVKEIEGINKFLQTHNPSGKFTVFFKGADGKRVSGTILCEDKNVIDQLVQQYKDSVVKDLSILAMNNHIEFDPEEKTILGL